MFTPPKGWVTIKCANCRIQLVVQIKDSERCGVCNFAHEKPPAKKPKRTSKRKKG